MSAKNFVIVESPTKAKTLGRFLGKDYEIVASMGHVRDLPRGEFGVDTENNFEPKYVIPKEKIKAVNQLAKTTANIENLFLATDPDREGEAIAWNLLKVIEQKNKIKNRKYERVVFHEITKDAVLDSFKHSRKIDANLVEAQQARRVLDRLVGYKLSPLLWKKVKSKLSAGRVQSVALRLVVDRETEIDAFKAEEYWTIEALVEGQAKVEFSANLMKIDEKKPEIGNKKDSDKVVSDLEKANYRVSEIKAKDARKYPNPPFTTSTMQQAASNNIGFSAKRTMRAAQKLYEKGLITYMRTDSVNLAPVAVSAVRKYIEKTYGKEYLPEQARHYKAKSKLAQEAHEAIRPTDLNVLSDSIEDSDEQKLYKLIHNRTIVCQMAEAVVAETVIEIEALGDGKYMLRASGQKIKFHGWYKVYGRAPIKEQVLPEIKQDENLKLKKITPTQKFTEPPARYTEATLIRDLEKHEIGRPSTYAPTISTLYDRFYIEKLEARKIGPTPIGKTVVEFLVKYFSNIVDLTFTAKMESDLDEIAHGNKTLPETMKSFWGPFEKQVDKVLEEAEKMKVDVEKTDEKCEKCGKDMVVRYGRFGKFLACSGFPDCKTTKALSEDTGIICPDDGGKVVMKRTRKGKPFWGCANWPECKYAAWKKPDVDKDGKASPANEKESKNNSETKSDLDKKIEEKNPDKNKKNS